MRDIAEGDCRALRRRSSEQQIATTSLSRRLRDRSVLRDTRNPIAIELRAAEGFDGDGEVRAMAVNIIGLGLIVAAVILMIMGGSAAGSSASIRLIGGVGALFMTWQRPQAHRQPSPRQPLFRTAAAGVRAPPDRRAELAELFDPDR